jgi:hypothetical protein
MKTLFALPLFAIAFPCFVACSSSSSGDGASNGNCSSIAGTWGVSGTCGPDTCIITQNGCNTSFACGGGSVSYTGSVNGSNVSYAGKTAGGVDGTCSGTVQGSTMSGTCTVSGATCSYSAAKE